MKRKGQAFTLIELLMVMLIIGIIIAMLMRVGPEVSRAIKVNQTQNFISALELGVYRYKRIFGAFPPSQRAERRDGNGNVVYYNPYDEGAPVFQQGESMLYLYIALQGPESFGWTRADHGVSAEFGPFFEAGASNIGELRLSGSNSEPWPVFTDNFNTWILYQKANKSNPPNLDSNNPWSNRYSYWTLRAIWGRQKGIGGWGAGGMWNVYSAHWKKKLTAVKRGGSRIPYNPDTFVLWSAGPDEKFGYWVYDDDELGMQFDLKTGTCDDITNFD